MAEMYTKPFESVQAAINLFEQKIDPTKSSTSTSKEDKGGFLKDLKDHNLQLEAKEHERNLAFFEFDASSKSPEELLALLKLCKAERDIYKEKFRKSQALFLEYEKGKHFFHFGSHFVSEESRPAAQRKNKVIKREISAVEENSQELFMHSSDFKKVILKSRLSNIEAKKHSSAFCTGLMEEDLKVPEAEVFQSQVQLEVLRRQLDEVEDLEHELLKQMIISVYLHVELKQSKELQTIFSKAVLSVTNELGLVKSENEQMKQANSKSENYIHKIEEQRKRMIVELNILTEKINGMNCQTEMLVDEILRMQEEMSEGKNNALEFQPNIATLTSELFNSSSGIAAAGESKASSMSAQVRLTQAMQQVSADVNEAKTEVPGLSEYDKAETENEESGSSKSSSFMDADSNGFCTGITISIEEYEFLIHKSKMVDNTKSESTKGYGADKSKRELQDKNKEISELTCRLEEAEKRAELAEKAKLAMESQLRKWRYKLLLKRAASDAAKGYCAMENESSRQHEMPFLSKLACINPKPHGIASLPKRSVSMHDGKKSKHGPLGKLLKIKF